MKKHSGGNQNLSKPMSSGIAHDKGSSMKQNTRTGSGSRPTGGSTTAMSSAPKDASLASHRGTPNRLK